ncbi:hypothetical protein [Ahrensia kielensis]|nr:hypothetical protein [Ahrensia kielensis]
MIKFGKKFETPKQKEESDAAAKAKAAAKEKYNQGLASGKANASAGKKA